jgi:phosphatidylglycerol lysyltransferase
MRRLFAPLVGAALFCVAVWVLTREFRHVGFPALAGSLATVPHTSVLAAVVLTALNYVVLTLHDQLAFRYAGARLRWTRVGLASFVGYAISNNAGFALLAGASARYRFYARWGLSAATLSLVVLFYSLTFWLGLCLLAGTALVIAPPAAIRQAGFTLVGRGAGVAAIAVVAAYCATCVIRRAPLRIGQFKVPMPSSRLLIPQIAVSLADWLLAAAVLYVLLPAPRSAFLPMAGAFTVAQLVGVASHVPGGLGVFEGLIVLLVDDAVRSDRLVAALIAFRLVYYLLPLAAALGMLLLDEALQRRGHLTRLGRTCTAVAAWAAPRILAVFTFAAGALLLFSGATPAIPERLAWLGRHIPLPLVEVSHFAGSLVGLLLLLLAQGIAERVDAAFYISAVALAIGAAASLLKGADYEEAALLSGVLAVLIAAKRHFTRRAGIFDRPLSPRWLAAVGGVIVASIWLGLFAYQHVDYTSDLWWQFAVHADAPRFLRTSIAVTVCGLVIGLQQLFRPAHPRRVPLEPSDLAHVDRAIARQPRATAALVYLGDKTLLWNSERSCFVMYAVRGRSCIALGDPVGPSHAVHETIQAFLLHCHRFALTPVFYEVSREYLADYADNGLTAVKIGEEARIQLATFSLDGRAHKALRSTLNRLDRTGYTFRVVPPAQVPPLLPELEEVSNEWLAAKNTSEKGFSLGYFNEGYLSRFPIGVIERGERIEAFANIWVGPGRIEISPDLMRYRTSAPAGVMDALFARIMLWARDQQCVWFNLGMAPLAGLRALPHDTWSTVARFVYKHGESLYNFKGLRAYKDKFHPVWEAKYLVYPGRLSLPRVITDITALIGGGYVRMFRRSAKRVA